MPHKHEIQWDWQVYKYITKSKATAIEIYYHWSAAVFMNFNHETQIVYEHVSHLRISNYTLRPVYILIIPIWFEYRFTRSRLLRYNNGMLIPSCPNRKWNLLELVRGLDTPLYFTFYIKIVLVFHQVMTRRYFTILKGFYWIDKIFENCCILSNMYI